MVLLLYMCEQWAATEKVYSEKLGCGKAKEQCGLRDV